MSSLLRWLSVFAIVLLMGVTLRFAPGGNWVWWADLAWIAWTALWTAVIAAAPRHSATGEG